MNLFNRIVVSILCLALVAGAIAVVVLAWTIPNETINALRDAVDWLEEHNNDLEKALLATGGSLLGLIALIVFLLELMPQSGAEVKVTDLRVGDAVLSTADIGQRVEEAVRLVPNVADVRASVKARRKGVQLALDLHVDPDANLALVTDEALQTATDVLTNRVHVALAEPPRARLHYRELRLRRPSTPPAPPPAPPPPMTPLPPHEDVPPRTLLKDDPSPQPSQPADTATTAPAPAGTSFGGPEGPADERNPGA